MKALVGDETSELIESTAWKELIYYDYHVSYLWMFSKP
jgi:hypothetical protein